MPCYHKFLLDSACTFKCCNNSVSESLGIANLLYKGQFDFYWYSSLCLKTTPGEAPSSFTLQWAHCKSNKMGWRMVFGGKGGGRKWYSVLAVSLTVLNNGNCLLLNQNAARLFLNWKVQTEERKQGRWKKKKVFWLKHNYLLFL